MPPWGRTMFWEPQTVSTNDKAEGPGRGVSGLGGQAWWEILRVPLHHHSQAGSSGMWGSEVVLRLPSCVWMDPSYRQDWPGLPVLGACPLASYLCVWWQLFWEKKLSGLNAFDIAEELVKTMDLPKGLQGDPRIAGGPGGSQWSLQQGE